MPSSTPKSPKTFPVLLQCGKCSKQNGIASSLEGHFWAGNCEKNKNGKSRWLLQSYNTTWFAKYQGCVIRSFGTFNGYVLITKNTYNMIVTTVFKSDFGSADFWPKLDPNRPNITEVLFQLVSTKLLGGDFTLVPTPRETLNWLKEPS